jgi:hypothetical protein
MLSKDTETLVDILSLVGKQVTEKQLAKKKQYELDEAEKWAVTYYCASIGKVSQKRVPKQPDWLWRL